MLGDDEIAKTGGEGPGAVTVTDDGTESTFAGVDEGDEGGTGDGSAPGEGEVHVWVKASDAAGSLVPGSDRT